MLVLRKNTLLASVLALLALVAVIACSSVGNNPDESDTIIEVLSVSPVTSDTTQPTVSDSTTIMLKALPRNPDATTFFNDVTFSNYEVTYSAFLAPNGGTVSTGYVPSGSTANLTLVVVPGGPLKAAVPAGSTIGARITVHGTDLSDHDLSFTATTTITFTAAPDSDADGVPDAFDNCPLVFNPSQFDTFPVIGNGVGDCCDPTTPGYPVCSP